MKWLDRLSHFTESGFIDLLLTFVLTVAVVWQTRLTGKLAKIARRQADISESQAQLAEEAEKRRRQLEGPRVRFVGLHYSFSEYNTDGSPKSIGYEGFSVTNEGLREVNIQRMKFDIAVKKDEEGVVTSPVIFPVKRYKKTKLSDDLPCRLRHGDTLKVYYSREDLIRIGTMVRAMCSDSLGNTYYGAVWCAYEGNTDIIRGDPGPGYLSWDECHQFGPDSSDNG